MGFLGANSKSFKVAEAADLSCSPSSSGPLKVVAPLQGSLSHLLVLCVPDQTPETAGRMAERQKGFCQTLFELAKPLAHWAKLFESGLDSLD